MFETVAVLKKTVAHPKPRMIKCIHFLTGNFAPRKWIRATGRILFASAIAFEYARAMRSEIRMRLFYFFILFWVKRVLFGRKNSFD